MVSLSIWYLWCVLATVLYQGRFILGISSAGDNIKCGDVLWNITRNMWNMNIIRVKNKLDLLDCLMGVIDNASVIQPECKYQVRLFKLGVLSAIVSNITKREVGWWAQRDANRVCPEYLDKLDAKLFLVQYRLEPTMDAFCFGWYSVRDHPTSSTNITLSVSQRARSCKRNNGGRSWKRLTRADVCVPGRAYCGHEIQRRGLGPAWEYVCKETNDTLQNRSIFASTIFKQPCSVCYRSSVDQLEPTCSGFGKDGIRLVNMTCTPGEHICGHQLQHKPQFKQANVENLYRCDSRTTVSFITCCEIHCGKSDAPRVGGCHCSPGREYCGFELNRMNFLQRMNDSLISNARYVCTRPTYVERTETCSYACTRNWANSTVCANRIVNPARPRTCMRGRFYCGSQLAEMGMSRVLNDTLYMCSANGSVMYHHTCDVGCNRGVSTAYCKCGINRTYCGYHLQQMNFMFPGLLPFARHRCTAGHVAAKLDTCPDICARNENGEAICTNRKKPIRKCIIGGYYCGHQLAQMEYEHVRTNALYYCDDVTMPRVQTNCPGACNSRTVEDKPMSFCSCAPHNRTYCGYYLRDTFNFVFPSLLNFKLYICQNDTMAVDQKYCLYDCVQGYYIARCLGEGD